MKNHFKIGRCTVGRGRCFIVAEVAQAHDGSLGQAHAFIDTAASACVDAVKFQTHIAAAESTAREPFRVRFSRQDETRYDYWKRMEFTPSQWKELAEHALDRGLEFLSSPFSVEALELLEKVGVPAWKVGSGELVNTPLLDAMIATGKPILLSSGMSPWSELDDVVERIRAAGNSLLVYQCATRYPAKPGQVGLSLLAAMRERYGCPVGLSDHSGTPYFGIAAAALGASSVEVHITMSRESFGPDVPASLTPDELAGMVRGIRAVERDLAVRQDKDAEADALKELKVVFGRSVVTRRTVRKGTRLTRAHLALKKPGGGLPPSALKNLLGKRARRDLPPDTFIKDSDLVSD